MTYYIVLTPNNQVLDVVETSSGIPTGAIEVTQEQYETLSKNPLVHYEYVSGELRESIYADIIEKVRVATQRINDICVHQITVEFMSSVLGTPHLYKNTIEDQINLADLNSSNQDAKIKCAEIDTKTPFIFKLHTREQIAQLYDEMKQHKFACLGKAATSKEQLIGIRDSSHVTLEEATTAINEVLDAQRQ